MRQMLPVIDRCWRFSDMEAVGPKLSLALAGFRNLVCFLIL